MASLDFDGANSKVDAGSPALLDNAEPFTVAAWVAPDSLGEGGFSYIVTKNSGASGSGFWCVGISAGPCIRFQKDYATADLRRVTTAGSIRTDGTWQHVAVTWTAALASGAAVVYIDGKTAAYGVNTTPAGSKYIDTALFFVIGNDRAQTSSFDGRIAQVQFFKRVLDAPEIGYIMRYPGAAVLGASGTTSMLVGYWPLGDFLGGQAGATPDYTPFRNNGVVTSVTTTASAPPINGMFVMPRPALAYAAFTTTTAGAVTPVLDASYAFAMW